MSLFVKKTLESTKTSNLKKVLGAFDLTLLGLGAIIGTGIFVITGQQASFAGPAVIFSFLFAGFACILVALCYSELSSAIPVAGSAYAYSYIAFGEIVAWIIGWALILSYGIGAATVASSWTGYFTNVLAGFNINLPVAITGAYNPEAGTYINLPGIILVFIVTWLLTRGASESAKWNSYMVYVKIGVVLLFVVVGLFYVEPENWTPFVPNGWDQVAMSAAIVVYAYLGFDAISTAAEEVKNPQRNIPIGIIASLSISTALYVLVSLILTGMVTPFENLNQPDAVAYALEFVGADFAAGITSLGVVFGLIAVLIVMMFSQSRMFYAMSRDGLLPKSFSKVDEKTDAPTFSIWVTGFLVAFFSGLFPLGALSQMVSMGTLFAFTFVALALMVLRKTQPNMERGFKTPFVPLIPVVAMLCTIFLMFQLPSKAWIGFVVWVVIGLLIYMMYGYRNSVARKKGKA